MLTFVLLSCIYCFQYYNWFVSVMFVNLTIMIIFWTKSLNTYFPSPYTFFLILFTSTRYGVSELLLPDNATAGKVTVAELSRQAGVIAQSVRVSYSVLGNGGDGCV